jgi:alkylation response protein AidB-like acyl-CoA dehydrogenase
MDFELPPDLKKMQEETRRFVDREIRPLVPDVEKRKKYPIEIVRRMAKQGIYRLLVPKEYGGTYETVQSLPICVVREELGRGHNFAGELSPGTGWISRDPKAVPTQSGHGRSRACLCPDRAGSRFGRR